MHIHLRAGQATNGNPVFEPVHVEALGGKMYRILATPGLVYGVAADDQIELADDGSYEVVQRGTNIAVRLYSREQVRQIESELTARVQAELGGRLDGSVERGLAYTVPVSAGFARVEVVFRAVVEAHPEAEWEYGNVYAEDGTPLNWWHSAA